MQTEHRLSNNNLSFVYKILFHLQSFKDNDYSRLQLSSQLQNGYNVQVSDNDLEALYVEANCYMLASHLYWAL